MDAVNAEIVQRQRAEQMTQHLRSIDPRALTVGALHMLLLRCAAAGVTQQDFVEWLNGASAELALLALSKLKPKPRRRRR